MGFQFKTRRKYLITIGLEGSFFRKKTTLSKASKKWVFPLPTSLFLQNSGISYCPHHFYNVVGLFELWKHVQFYMYQAMLDLHMYKCVDSCCKWLVCAIKVKNSTSFTILSIWAYMWLLCSESKIETTKQLSYCRDHKIKVWKLWYVLCSKENTNRC